MKNLALLGMVSLALTGCPDSGMGGSRLIGTWDELPGLDNEEPPSTATFNADGTFEVIDDRTESGTYEEVGDTLILTTEAKVEELPYATDGQLFTPVGLRHVGGGAGFAGEWRAEGTNDGQPEVMALQLETDNTFMLELDNDLLTGTWRETDGELITTLQVPDDNGQTANFDIPWHSIGDTISLIAYQRR